MECRSCRKISTRTKNGECITCAYRRKYKMPKYGTSGKERQIGRS